MSNDAYKYIWRCAKCSQHFSNITKMDGILRQEKKCPKCKSLNTLTLGNREIFIHCKLYDANLNGYSDEINGSYPYPDME